MNKKEKQVGKISPHDHPFKPDPKDGACKVCGCLEGTHRKEGGLGFREKLRDIISQVGYEMVGELDNDQATDLILKLIREELEKIDPLEATYCGEWDESDVIACGVHKYILEQLVGEAMLRKLGGEQSE